MKKFLVVLLVCVMFIPSAFAVDTNDFNIYASVFGASEVNNGTESTNDNGNIVTQYYSDECRIVFIEESGKTKSIAIVGQGDKFLAYCAAAIMVFDHISDNRTTNYGQLLSIYLLAIGDNSKEDHTGMTVSGSLMAMQNSGESCRFIIVR